MSQPPTNHAAYITAPKARPLSPAPAPYTKPGANELVIRTRAVAINPIDSIFQDQGSGLFNWVKYPFVLGSDVAGDVVEVGAGVNRFKAGDRVVGHACGLDKNRNTNAEGGFQEYVVLMTHMTAQIPERVTFEEASVIPLGLTTAACGLFTQDQLALPFPSTGPTPQKKTLLIWGGSTSVGCNAIQLAVAAGFEVFATASPRNFGLVKSLGAAQVFDYSSKTVVAEIVAAMKGRTTAGALSMATGAEDGCVDILKQCKGNKFVARASFPLPHPMPESFVMLRIVANFLSWSISQFVKGRLSGVSYKFVPSLDIISNGVGKAVYEDFLPDALAKGVFTPAPEPQVTGHGLENIQHALDVQKAGVSAKKVVVTL